MRGRWNNIVLFIIFVVYLQTSRCFSLNIEGLALLEFRSKVEIDPYSALERWDPKDKDPCNWSGVHCIDGKVEMLDLKEQLLGGVLAPELGKLSRLRALVLYKNNFTGVIPKEIGQLTMLEVLDLRGNNLNGTIPAEIGEMLSLKCLLLRDNKFKIAPSWIEKPDMLSDLKFNQSLSYEVACEIGCVNRKFGHCIWQRGLQQLKKAGSLVVPFRQQISQLFDMLPLFKFGWGSSHGYGEKHGDSLSSSFAKPYIKQNIHVVNIIRRRLLQETSNLAAVAVSSAPPQEVVTVPSIGSGSFPAVPGSNGGKKLPSSPTKPTNPVDTNFAQTPTKPSNSVDGKAASSKGLGFWLYVLIALGVVLLINLAATILLLRRRKKKGPIGPWKSGLSGQLQKAFVAGVPKLNRTELEAACEDFSNIIITLRDNIVFKGTLSSGVEIAVVSTAAKSTMDWSEQSELCFRKKIDTISRVNHKNFVNLLGYCEENEPFMRMMVFEYAPNGSLFEHLHLKEFEHLDWSARMRVIMGIAYCLQYMHHDLKPPVPHPNLKSDSIFITDDFAAKIGDIGIYNESTTEKVSGDGSKDPSELHAVDPESNVYSFGILMLEIISGKIPFSKEGGSITDWAAECMSSEHNISSIVDQALKSSKDNELEIICELIQDCIRHDPKKRPTMKEVTTALRGVLGITPEAASPRLSPLWWAELEILSVEAS